MWRFKKSGKSRRRSQQLGLLEVPTHIAVGSLGFDTGLVVPEGVFRFLKSTN